MGELLELAIITAYWEELFHAEDPLPDEKEWREGLIKRSSQYDSFQDWQDCFRTEYAKVYKDNNIWSCIVLTSWAHTHQYDVRYTEQDWQLLPSQSYLPTSQMWRLEPHINSLREILGELWSQELKSYASAQFTINETPVPFLGRLECLGFDTKKYTLIWPPQMDKKPEVLDIADMVANIVLPQGDNWYRHLDNIIFADDLIDVTALINRTCYVFGSHRRLLELCREKDLDKAKTQVQAEGWLVQEKEETAII
jgi:hypothetical protein